VVEKKPASLLRTIGNWRKKRARAPQREARGRTSKPEQISISQETPRSLVADLGIQGEGQPYFLEAPGRSVEVSQKRRQDPGTSRGACIGHVSEWAKKVKKIAMPIRTEEHAVKKCGR